MFIAASVFEHWGRTILPLTGYTPAADYTCIIH